METRILGKDLEVSAVGLGCMGMSHAYGRTSDKKEAQLLLEKALEKGCTFFDIAEVYGTAADPHHNEKLIGEILKLHRNGALDVARAVRFIRKNADAYGIDKEDIAVMGFSAGGIQAGEFWMHYDEKVTGAELDKSYVPDELDEIPAHASADGMIYSFYGMLSVGNMDKSWLAEGNLPPIFYVYGTEDPFYDQFEQQYKVVKGMGINTRRIVLDGWPHGFGADGGWVKDYAAWLEKIFKS